jgi:hypothetical protein
MQVSNILERLRDGSVRIGGFRLPAPDGSVAARAVLGNEKYVEPGCVPLLLRKQVVHLADERERRHIRQRQIHGLSGRFDRSQKIASDGPETRYGEPGLAIQAGIESSQRRLLRPHT